MSNSKSRKQEIGLGRSTENRAIAEDTRRVVSLWLNKVDQCQGDPEEIKKVLTALIKETQEGKIDREVISKLLAIRPLKQSFAMVLESRLRRHE